MNFPEMAYLWESLPPGIQDRTVRHKDVMLICTLKLPWLCILEMARAAHIEEHVFRGMGSLRWVSFLCKNWPFLV